MISDQYLLAPNISSTCMPWRRQKNCSSSAGLRPSSSFTLSGVRLAVSATAAATLAADGAAMAEDDEARANEIAKTLVRRMYVFPFDREVLLLPQTAMRQTSRRPR